jgi:hypothetical protein
MIKTRNRFTVIDCVADADAAARQRAVRIVPRVAACLAALLTIVVGISAWFIVSTGVSGVSAAAVVAQPTPQVPYFPSQYINQATEYEPTPPPTF